jgi:hypothetical protein
MTVFGRVRFARLYTSGDAETGGYAADAALGIDGGLSLQARRLATYAALGKSFARAAQTLSEFCGWTLGEETIRRLAHAEAKRARAERPERADAERFAKAPGEVEVPIDAGKVNTLDGWRDVKLAVFCKRLAGRAATPDEWDIRRLPAPSIRLVVAAIEDSESFGERVRDEADRLGATTDTRLTVLGDGAEWIWNLAADRFPGAGGVLDVYHALEHIAGAAKAVWGEGTEAAKTHAEAGRRALLAEGKAGAERWLAATIAGAPEGVSTDPLLGLAAYLAKHPTRLDSAGRLAAGRSIGSGAVEGAVKQLVNLRLKRTGARWRADHVGPFVELLALWESDEWSHLWTAA